MRGRFAPTPSGELHLGGARTALCAWLQARAAGGAFVMRVEDLDRPRAVPGAEARILEDLRWLGLDWDEGPDVGGPHAPYRQADRLPIFHAAIDQLLAEGKAFECFCSRKEVQQASQAPHGPADDGPRYPGTCRALSRAEADDRRNTRLPSIRLRMEPGERRYVDLVQGERREDPAATVGDFVLRRADGIPAYQLAVVVDDAAMAITDVLRGDDLSSSTARQLALYDALGLAPPRFAHVPLLLGPDGTRLSKRHGAIGVRTYAERGVSPERMVGLLAWSLGLAPPDAALHPRELVSMFDLAAIAAAPPSFNFTALSGSLSGAVK
jgi:glutamyl-tRNA synthetase